MKAIALILVFCALCYAMPIKDDLLKKEGSSKGASWECSLCTFVVNDVEYYLTQNATTKEIAIYINEICSTAVFQAYEAVCESIFEYGVLEFIHFIETNEQPQVVCTQIELCQAAKQAIISLKKINV